MTSAYEIRAPRRWQPFGDAQWCAVAGSAIIAVWLGVAGLAVVAAVVAIIWRRVDLLVCVATVGLIATLCAARAWTEVGDVRTGPFQGWATLVSDPERSGVATRVVLEIEGQRFQVFAYGSPGRRLVGRQAGEQIEVEGQRGRLSGRFARRAQVRHIVGDFDLATVGGSAPARPLERSANRVRSALRGAAERSMPADLAALFSGLVLGDDAREPAAMVEQFRTAGLSHLTAVSGQNVAFVLAVAAVGLRRLRRWWRLAATLALICWFVVLTRLEPSVVRAGAMAAWSATAFAWGREMSPIRSLANAVLVLVIVDPLLVWSVAFWLSVGATMGVCVVGPWLQERFTGPGWLTAPLAVTLGAQIGVLIPSWLVFHRMSAVGPLANLLAVPVGGFVMLYGIPAGLVAAMLPGPVADLVMLPGLVGTRWVSTVAALAARYEPKGAWAVAVWSAEIAAFVGLAVRTRWYRPLPTMKR